MRVQVDVMLRIAALVGAITLLTACGSGDIVVKTDLDEKYIIKESAVTKIDIDWEEYKVMLKERLKSAEKTVADTRKYWDNCLGKDGSYPLSEAHCRGSWGTIIEPRKERVEQIKEDVKELDRLLSLEDEIATTVRYRPIFVAVNNEKSALGYATSTCLNPSVLGSEDSESLFRIFNLEEGKTKKERTAKDSAYLSVSKEVCNKYAYTGTVKFSYAIDEDQDKDKKD